ncbi:hypothetical protein [Halostagnicola sp. A56]|uniref:hypothetical protein n=1 Tax=Halostagnicola sp. A56 TaxID=1495067 RepID=UPI0012E17DD1|nr:hypothetical protein [Halostagnicola sp. A56]
MASDTPDDADAFENTGDTDTTERTDLVFNIDPDTEYENEDYAMLYHYDDAGADFGSSPDGTNLEDDWTNVAIEAEDPHSDETSTVQLSGDDDRGLAGWMEQFESDRAVAVNNISERVPEIYDQINEGEVPPSQYESLSEFVTDGYGTAMGENYAADLYFEMRTGANVTDPDQQMEIETSNNETLTGGLILSDTDNVPRIHADNPTPLGVSINIFGRCLLIWEKTYYVQFIIQAHDSARLSERIALARECGTHHRTGWMSVVRGLQFIIR